MFDDLTRRSNVWDQCFASSLKTARITKRTFFALLVFLQENVMIKGSTTSHNDMNNHRSGHQIFYCKKKNVVSQALRMQNESCSPPGLKHEDPSDVLCRVSCNCSVSYL